jgi:catechol 2,3-dioxygenase-like lactoylglutathione lyase family enzyme
MRLSILIATGTMFASLSFAANAENTPPKILIGTKAPELILSKITVADLRKSFDFYTKVIGLKKIDFPGSPTSIDDPNRNTNVAEVCLSFSGTAADSYLCLIKLKNVTPDPDHAKLTWIGVKTTDTRSAIARVKAAGFLVQIEATNYMGLVVGTVTDPDGYVVEMIEGPSWSAESRSRQ